MTILVIVVLMQIVINKIKVYFFKYLLNYCNKNYNSNEYQSIGALMFNKIFIENKILITDIQKSIKNVMKNIIYLGHGIN